MIERAENALGKFLEIIEGSPFLLKEILETYERMIRNEGIPKSQFENTNLQEITQLLRGQLHLQISHHLAEGKDNLVRFTAYSLLKLKINFPLHSMPDDHVLVNIASGIASELKVKDASVAKSLEETNQFFDVIKSESSTLHQQLKKAKLDIARRYNATL